MPSSYFPLDLNFFDHPKVVGLGDKAARMYLASVAYANRLMTDGFIADPIAGRLVEWDHYDSDTQAPDDCARELDRAVLWHRADVPCPRGHDDTCPKLGGDGWRIHDFLDHNRSRDERTGEREAERKRKAAYRAAQRESQQDRDAGVPPGRDAGVPLGRVPDVPPLSRPDRSNRETTATQGRSTPLSLVPSDALDPDPVALVFHAWVASFPNPTRRDLTPARRDAIKAALKRYPLDDVRDAVCGWRHDPWPERAQQNDLAQLLHMGSKRRPANILERMRDLHRNGPPATNRRRGMQEPASWAALRELQ